MRAFGFRTHGDLGNLQPLDLPDPVAGDGEVRLRVRAAGLNRLDRFVLTGIPGVPIPLPHVLGSDASGVVDTVGDGVVGWSPGDRVLLNPGLWDGSCDACRAHQESLCRQFRIVGEHTQGTIAEYVVVPARNVHRLPGRMTFEEGAAAPLVFQTAWRALLHVGALQPGETVAIVGAGGGTNTAALQIARWRGARVVVTTRSEAKAEQARRSGATDVLVVGPDRPADRALWEWSGRKGVDLIFDSAGAASVPASVKALARGGRVVVIGATSGPVVPLDLRTLFWRQASVRGSTMANASEFLEVMERLSDGSLRPVVDSVHDFDHASQAVARLDAPELFGKVVVRGPA